MDRAVKFYIDKHKSIEAVLELRNYVGKQIEKFVVDLIYSPFDKECREWRWGKKGGIDLRIYRDNYCVTWADRAWFRKKEEVGVYFGAECFDLDAIVSPEDGNEPYLYLYQDQGGEVGKLTKGALRSAVATVDGRLKEFGANAEAQTDRNGTYLVRWSLRDVINIDRLKDEEAVAADFVQKAKQFTELIAPCIYAVGA
jgi:hypothetical protein